MNKIAVVLLCGLLGACGGEESGGTSPPSTQKPPSNELPSQGTVTEEQLRSAATVKNGFSEIVIAEDSNLTLRLEEFTVSKSNNDMPEKLIISGNLTIKN